MMKKMLAVLLCVLTLAGMCTVCAFAEEAGQNSGLVWDLWKLLSPQNLDFLQLLSILVTTLVTLVRAVSGGGLKEFFELLMNSVKNLIPGKSA